MVINNKPFYFSVFIKPVIYLSRYPSLRYEGKLHVLIMVIITILLCFKKACHLLRLLFLLRYDGLHQ